LNSVIHIKRACPLCQGDDGQYFSKDKYRNYFRCRVCRIVFISPSQFLSAEDEKAEYDLHQNTPEDTAYRKFLSRIFLPVNQMIKPGSCGLDFGSGPGPTLSVMFQEAGHTVSVYDCFYAADEAVFAQRYDFITLSEVAEHLHDPAFELKRLWKCLKPGGVMAIMTKMVIDREAFSSWHYKNDRTHICFFSKETFLWLADKLKTKAEFRGNDVVILPKLNFSKQCI